MTPLPDLPKAQWLQQLDRIEQQQRMIVEQQAALIALMTEDDEAMPATDLDGKPVHKPAVESRSL